MPENEEEAKFPIEVDSKLIRVLQWFILISIKLLACLMALVIIWSIIDLTYNIYVKAVEPPFLLVRIDDLLKTFGGFLIVMIAIEIFINIIMYFTKSANHLRLVVATALMAIARKVIILDYDQTSPITLFAIGAIIAALAVAYWLIRPQRL